MENFFNFRHIALRRDHYECAVLFLMRSARLDIKNENGEVPEDCMILHKNPKCKMIVKVINLAISMYRNVTRENQINYPSCESIPKLIFPPHSWPTRSTG